MVEPLFIDPNLVPAEKVTLTGQEAKHAISVRRMRVGEAIAISNGKGLKLRGEVSSIDKNSLEATVTEVIQEDLPKLRFTLVQALAKGDRDELAIQAATELGIWSIIPWSADRSVSRWEEAKKKSGRERWQQIVTEAAKQSLRSFIPDVSDVLPTNQLVKQLASFDLVLVLEPTAATRLADLKLPSQGTVAIVVGPEGGISSEELELLAGFSQITLGINVLRTSTAGPAVLAALTLGRNQA